MRAMHRDRSRVPLESRAAVVHDGVMKFVSVSRARANLSELIRSVEAGEEVIVTRGGVPAMKVVRPDVTGQRRIGIDAGVFTVPESFDDPINWAEPQASNL